jgi:hypothetical protein
MTALFLAGIYGTSVRSLVKPKVQEETSLFSTENNAGISGSFFLSIPISDIVQVKRKCAISQLVRKLSLVTPCPAPDV